MHICEKVYPCSLDGNSYFVITAKDDSTRFCLIYMTENRSSAVKVLQN